MWESSERLRAADNVVSLQAPTSFVTSVAPDSLGRTPTAKGRAYVRNALNKGDQDAKFRTIPLDNAAFKKRVSGLVGGVALLKAVGIVKNDPEGQLQLDLPTREANLAHLNL